MENKVFGQSGKVGETDKLNIDSIIARLLEGKHTPHREAALRSLAKYTFSFPDRHSIGIVQYLSQISQRVSGWT